MASETQKEPKTLAEILDRLEGMEKAATPGPWCVVAVSGGVRHLERNCSEWYHPDSDDKNVPGRQGSDGGRQDGEFICEARSQMAHLLRLVRAGEEVYRCLEGTSGEHAEGVCEGYRAAVKALEDGQ